MSLKAFHVIFITASSALAFGCGIWGLKNYFGAEGRVVDLLFGLGSIAAGIGLIAYERYFPEKAQERQLSMNMLLACAACFGQSDSPLAKGMNWGIFQPAGGSRHGPRFDRRLFDCPRPPLRRCCRTLDRRPTNSTYDFKMIFSRITHHASRLL